MPTADVDTNLIVVGGNRHPSAADWDPISGLLAFGADQNIALWNPKVQTIHDLCTDTSDD
jgi:elongator complex protein 2